jgi:hypothetical protein
MLRWIKEVCLGSEPVEFVSAYGLEESVERLKSATKRSVFFSLGDAGSGRHREVILRIPAARHSDGRQLL